jgi:dihydropteroate synthase|tara:strand:- start:1881 stop:2648 length:768 start_codon:yes stop_codon:yes gene_type:complete
MGILNLTPDSFSDGGRFNTPEAALARVVQLVEEGADIIDIGGESTRPKSHLVSTAEELLRVIPVIEQLREALPNTVLSIDTTKPIVAEEALKRGVHILNDVHGLHGEGEALAALTAKYDAGLVIMHNSRLRPIDGDPIESMRAYFEDALSIADRAGVSKSKIILDPGIGFGKEVDENWALLRRLKELKQMGLPLLLGASRKKFLGEGLDIDNPDDRDMATVGTTVVGIEQGIDIVRVHDVKSNRDAALVADRTYR